jgi:uncharacterized protein YecT (DUF1311 family)
MNYQSRIFGLFLIVLFSPFTAQGSASCLYCGNWIPFSSVGGSPYSSGDRLRITEQNIALPGCASAPVRNLLFDAGYPQVTVFRIENLPECSKALFGLAVGSLVEVGLRPGHLEGGEEIFLSIFPADAFEDLKASYVYELAPTPQGEKQNIRKHPRPKEIAQWWFVREGYDPCGEGYERGAWICASLKHKKADEALNEEWQRLISIVPQEDKETLNTRQKRWLKEMARACLNESGALFPAASDLFCWARRKIKRSDQFRELYECIRSGRSQCPQLPSVP